MLPGRCGGYPPHPPQTRTCATSASGSSVAIGLPGPLGTHCLPVANQRLREFLWRTTMLPNSHSAVFLLTRFVVSMYLSSFLTAVRCARLRLPYSGSLGPQFPTFPVWTPCVHIPSVLCSATTAHRPSLVPSLVTRPQIPSRCKETMGSPKFPSYPLRYMPRSQTPVVSRPLALSRPGLLPSAACKASAFLPASSGSYPTVHDYTYFEAQSHGLHPCSPQLRTPVTGLARGVPY